MMRETAVVLACLLTVTGGLVLFAGAPRSTAPAAPPLTAAGAFGTAIPASDDGPRDLVPPAPWNIGADPGPFLSLNRSRHPRPSPITVTGEAKLLAILVAFNDTSNSSSHTPAFFDNLLYNASSSSMNKFYRDNSYNMFNISGNVTTKFYTMSHTMAYYGTYETWSPPPGGYGNSQDLTYDVVSAADADINYSEYDQDSDGYIDHLTIIHAGGDEAATGVTADIWSHAWGLNSKAVKLDGVWINAYTMLSEDDPVGVFVHEFGHDLGLPDLYDTDYSSDGGCGKWEVMASGSWNNGGYSPSMLGAWCRKELGWISPTVINSDTAGLAAKRIFDNQTAFKVWVNNSNNEYFLIENRQQTGWDSYLPGSGLLVWHINESASGNTRDSYRLVDLEEWDNNNLASNANDAWKSNATGLTPNSAPNTNDYSGKKTDIRIYNISASGATMYLDVDLGNNPPDRPTPTAPSDGAWLGTSKPTVNWTFTDPDTGDTQAAFRVQADGDSAFGSVDYDSGEVAGSVGHLTFGSAVAEGTWYWHVMTRDGGGLWSTYSVARYFSIDLTAPAAPTALSATPSGWTATNSFSVDWTAPTESGTSGIVTGAYYKLDNAPTGATDGTWASSKPITGITVGSAGNHTIYVWLKDTVGNINQSNRETTSLRFDNVAPANPNLLSSPTHAVNAWSNLSVIQAQWSGASDADSGLDGFSYTWDTAANTVPDTTRDCASDISTASSAQLSDGTYYFHIRAVDMAGNWAAGAIHLGPFMIDLTPPGGVLGVSSSSHIAGKWSNLNVVAVRWWGAADGGSGVGLYACAWDRSPGTVPDIAYTVGAGVSTLSSLPLADSAGWYFHIRVRDAVGNWNATAIHFGPLDIDTTAPSNPDSYSVFSKHVVGAWSPDRLVKIAWSGQSDMLSGVDGFSISWDADPAGTAGMVENVAGAGYNETDLNGRAYLHIRAVDVAGNWAGVVYTVGPFLIDIDPPSAPQAAAEKALTNSGTLRWSWSPATDSGSGVAYYVVWIVNDPARPQEGMQDRSPTESYTFRNALGGKTYHIQVRAVDAVGNPGQFGAFSSGTLVDLAPPRDVRLAIDSGAARTAVPNVTLSVSATDRVSGVADMRLSQDGTEWTAWAPFAASQELTLAPGDGSKMVWLEVRDLAGNAARPVRASIVLDTTGPQVTRFGQVGGSGLTARPQVALEVSASDLHSRVVQVRLSPDGERWEPWQAYGPVLDWALAGGDGGKDIHVQARDSVGNIGHARTLTLMLDTTPPAAPVVASPTHPKADIWYNLPEVRFDWQTPADATGIAGYAWILTPDAGDEPGFIVQLTVNTIKVPVPGEGRWHFKVRAVDAVANCGGATTFSFRIDLSGPAPPQPELPTDNRELLPEDQVSLSWSGASDALSGLDGFYVQVDTDAGYSSPDWEGLVDGTSSVLPALPEGSYNWHVKARDAAGNWGEYGPGSTFGIHTPVEPIPATHKEPFLSLANPLFLITLVAVLAVIGGSVAAAARRRKKEPPAEAPAASGAAPPVNWE